MVHLTKYLFMVLSTTHRTLAPGSHFAEIEVKKSRFLGYSKHVKNWDEASNYLHSVKSEHPKARHWCYGFRCGTNPVNERSNDDGEPSGTAGAPILNAISGEGLSDVMCIVVRYFGGVKLGTGGLIRAYGAAARQVLREAPIEELIPMSSLYLVIQSAQIGAVYEVSSKVGSCTTRDEDYRSNGTVSLTLVCESGQVEAIKSRLRDATRGDVKFLEKEETYDDDDDDAE